MRNIGEENELHYGFFSLPDSGMPLSREIKNNNSESAWLADSLAPSNFFFPERARERGPVNSAVILLLLGHLLLDCSGNNNDAALDCVCFNVFVGVQVQVV